MLQLIHSIDTSRAKFYKLLLYHHNIFFQSRTIDNLSIVYWAYIYSSS